MTIKALLTTALLLGSSTLALARPATPMAPRATVLATPALLAAPQVPVTQATRTAADRDHQTTRNSHSRHDRLAGHDRQGRRFLSRSAPVAPVAPVE